MKHIKASNQEVELTRLLASLWLNEQDRHLDITPPVHVIISSMSHTMSHANPAYVTKALIRLIRHRVNPRVL